MYKRQSYTVVDIKCTTDNADCVTRAGHLACKDLQQLAHKGSILEQVQK